jgi:hypothetical protein
MIVRPSYWNDVIIPKAVARVWGFTIKGIEGQREEA